MNDPKSTSRFLIMAAFFLLFNLGAFFHVMDMPVGPNEHMYIAASVLSESQTMYKDFAFVQMPLLPLIYGIIYKLSGATHYLLLARLITLLFFNLCAICIYLISGRALQSFTPAFLITLVFMFNSISAFVIGESSNYVAAMFFSAAALYFFGRGALGPGVRPRSSWPPGFAWGY